MEKKVNNKIIDMCKRCLVQVVCTEGKHEEVVVEGFARLNSRIGQATKSRAPDFPRHVSLADLVRDWP